jgi:hypothetical protein
MPVTVTAGGLPAAGALINTVTGTAGPFAAVSSPGLNIAGSTTIQLQTSVTLSSGSLSSYEGNGLLPFNVEVASSSGSYSGNAGSMIFFGGSASSYGTLEVEYFYNTNGGSVAVVPEPPVVWMGVLLLGVSGMDLARRLRRIPSAAW